MICKVCGSEFNIENFDVCPYCMSPVDEQNIEIGFIEKVTEEKESVFENFNVVDKIRQETTIDESNAGLNYMEDEYEITEADLIEEKEKQLDLSIEELGLSVRALNALKRARVYTLNSLIEFLASNDLSDLRSVGAKTVQEIEGLVEGLATNEIIASKNKTKETAIYLFQNMSPDLDFLSIMALTELGFMPATISKLVANGIRCCGALRTLSKKEITKIISDRLGEKIEFLAIYLEKDIISLTTHVLDNFRKNREFNVFLRRAQGETLQEIANNPQEDELIITRERVRQLERSFLKSIYPFARELFYICMGSSNYVSVQDLLDVFDNDEYSQVLLYACKLIDGFEYVDFADIIIERRQDDLVENLVLSVVRDIVGNGIDLSVCRNDMEEALLDYGINYIGIDAIKNLLKKYNYHFYGDFVTKGKGSYATICMYVIKQHFLNGIKLSQSEDEQSEDLKKLREIVDTCYKGIELPNSDRALSSTLARSGLVLCGRGQYIPEEQVVLDENIMSDIKDYIERKELNRVYYQEIYAEYEGVLNLVCGVDNYNYLHGLLALRFPDEYEYSKDYLIKKYSSSSKVESIPDRIFKFINKIGRPVSKKELEYEFRGFSPVMLFNAITNDSRLFQWEYNYFSSTSILHVTTEDITNIERIIVSIFDENRGYASDAILFERISNEYPEFLEKNNIKSDMSLHYIVAVLFEGKMDFRRPHIGRKNDIDILNTRNIVLYLLNYPEEFSYVNYMKLVNKMGWAPVTASLILSDLEEDYARISTDKYLLKSKVILANDMIGKIRNILIGKMTNGLLPIANLDFDDFPDWDFEWNEILLETIVVKYMPEFAIIQPCMKDRRYQKGILVMADSGVCSYPQIIAKIMKQSGYEKMSESQFLSFLIVNNLTRKTIPNELNSNEYIQKEGDCYCIVK